MAFTVREQHFFKHKVDVRVPVDGGFRTETFTAHFKALPKEEALALVLEAQENGDAHLLREILVGFEDIKDEDGNAVEYSEESRDTLLNIPYVSIPLIQAYHKATVGIRIKN